jgi:hypothetical protein
MCEEGKSWLREEPGKLKDRVKMKRRKGEEEL